MWGRTLGKSIRIKWIVIDLRRNVIIWRKKVKRNVKEETKRIKWKETCR
jgi:hypothetical protein